MADGAPAAIEGIADWADRRRADGESAVPAVCLLHVAPAQRGFARTVPGATELLVSWVPADGGPEPFYRSLGFEPTGEIDDGEVVARLAL